MENIGFYSEDELMDLLVEGAIDTVDFLIYSPQWHDFYCDFCYERGLDLDSYSASLFLNFTELEEVASYSYTFDQEDYPQDDREMENLITNLDFLD